MNRIRVLFKATPGAAIVSFAIGIITIFMFFATAVLSIIGKGNAGMIIGILGVAAMLLNVVGLVLATKSSSGEPNMEKKYGLVLVSIGLNGFMFIFYMIFYVFGFMVNI